MSWDVNVMLANTVMMVRREKRGGVKRERENIHHLKMSMKGFEHSKNGHGVKSCLSFNSASHAEHSLTHPSKINQFIAELCPCSPVVGPLQ